MKERIKAGLVAVVLSTSLAVSVIAGPLEDGRTASARDDYATLLRYLRPLAEQGNPYAMSSLGLMFYKGQGVPQNYVEAARWLGKAAEQGNAPAMFYLGLMLDNGQGVPQNYVEAARWYGKAAEQGKAPAMFNLGLMFYKGQGVPQNYVEAARWYRKAAEQGEPSAMLNLGVMLHEGQGLPQNFVEAHKWINLAAANYKAGETGLRDNAVKARDLLAGKMTAAQIAEAQSLAREWKPKSALPPKLMP